MFIIYGKSPTCKKFSPLGKIGLVNRLIHAVMYQEKYYADKKCRHLNTDNPYWIFKVREQKKRRVEA